MYCFRCLPDNYQPYQVEKVSEVQDIIAEAQARAPQWSFGAHNIHDWVKERRGSPECWDCLWARLPELRRTVLDLADKINRQQLERDQADGARRDSAVNALRAWLKAGKHPPTVRFGKRLAGWKLHMEQELAYSSEWGGDHYTNWLWWLTPDGRLYRSMDESTFFLGRYVGLTSRGSIDSVQPGAITVLAFERFVEDGGRPQFSQD